MKHKIRLLIGLAVLTVACLISGRSAILLAANCPGFTMTVNNSSNTVASSAITVTGIVPVNVATTNTMPVSKVTVRANGLPIGRTQTNSSNTWGMPWVTSLYPNVTATPVMIDAEVTSTDLTTTCTVPGIPVYVANPTASHLTAVANPTVWQGPMSFSFPISVSTTIQGVSFDPTPYSLFQWGTTIGSINPYFNQAQFSSGQTVGTGSIGIQVKYGGGTVGLSIPVTVKSPDAPLPAPSTTTTTTTTTTTDGTSTTPEAITRVATLQNNPVAQDCTIKALGEARFTAINTGVSRPTLDEIKKFTACFASSNYILPSNFSPVAPAAIKDLPKADSLSINKPENVTKLGDNGKTLGLKFGGKAKPDSVVLLYIFSDPLVLTTTSDKDGNWTYTLEDPIESGKHEVYTVVDRGDGAYQRSGPISFFLGTASAAEANPNGLSLILAEQSTPAQSNRSLIFYALGAFATVALVLVSMYLLIRRRSKKIAPVETAPENPALEAAPSEGSAASAASPVSPRPETPPAVEAPTGSSGETAIDEER